MTRKAERRTCSCGRAGGAGRGHAGAAVILGGLFVALGSGHASAQERSNPRTDYTAYTRPAGRAAVGPFKLEMGIIDQVTVGTYVPPWFAFPVIGVPVPSVYVKLGSWWSGPLTVAVRGGFAFIDAKGVAELSDAEATASAAFYSAELDGSLRLSHWFSISLGFDYNHAEAVGGSEQVASSIEGASTADTWSTRLLGEWRMSHSFSLNLLIRCLLYQSPLNADVTTESEAASVEGDLSAEGSRRRRLSVIPGISYAGERWELQAGLGYGVVYIPVLGLPSSKSWPLLELGFAYRFDLY